MEEMLISTVHPVVGLICLLRVSTTGRPPLFFVSFLNRIGRSKKVAP